ncbi:MAG: hypothetical protein DMG24_19940 [Acidobacteria bacterium]|nr:MAG: hypothetical protein DMG24_19940 [Acidobacteriota bacterium]
MTTFTRSTTFTTACELGGGVMAPVLPNNLDLLSRPSTYVDWEIRATDGREHEAAVYYDNTAALVVNTLDEEVVWSTAEGPDWQRVGRRRPAVSPAQRELLERLHRHGGRHLPGSADPAAA